MNNLHLASRDAPAPLVIFLIATLLIWATGLSFWIQDAHAATLTSVSDTLSDSDLSVVSNHTIKFTTPTGVSAAETITYQFASAAGEFTTTSIAALLLGDVDFDIAGTDQTVTSTASCVGATTVRFTTSTTGLLTIKICTSNSVAANATTTFKVGTNASGGVNQITNPTSAASYTIQIAGTQTDNANLRVAIIDDVVVTATVDTSLTFTISGINSGQTSANGESSVPTTSVTSTATTIPWGTLVPGTAKVARQDLAVSTNATNGFVVTIEQNQNLLSSSGADIDLFVDGNATSVPSAWASPAGTLGSEDTYGHYGLTSADDLNSDEFGTALYVGNVSSTPRQIFSHTGPADGSTANQGKTEIGFKIEIDELQEAGTDYTNSLTYIVTPTF